MSTFRAQYQRRYGRLYRTTPTKQRPPPPLRRRSWPEHRVGHVTPHAGQRRNRDFVRLVMSPRAPRGGTSLHATLSPRAHRGHWPAARSPCSRRSSRCEKTPHCTAKWFARSSRRRRDRLAYGPAAKLEITNWYGRRDAAQSAAPFQAQTPAVQQRVLGRRAGHKLGGGAQVPGRGSPLSVLEVHDSQDGVGPPAHVRVVSVSCGPLQILVRARAGGASEPAPCHAHSGPGPRARRRRRM